MEQKKRGCEFYRSFLLCHLKFIISATIIEKPKLLECPPDVAFPWTDKKENQIFLIYKEIQNGAVAKSYMTNGFLICGEIFAHFLIYYEALPHIWLCNCSTLNFPIYEENLIFFFISLSILVCLLLVGSLPLLTPLMLLASLLLLLIRD